mgnify:FL=1
MAKRYIIINWFKNIITESKSRKPSKIDICAKKFKKKSRNKKENKKLEIIKIFNVKNCDEKSLQTTEISSNIKRSQNKEKGDFFENIFW